MSLSFRAAEFRHATRALLRTPAIVVSAVICLALGIGTTTAIASAVGRALLDKPPFADPDRIVAVHRITPHSGPLGTWPSSVPNYIDLSQRVRSIASLAAIAPGGALVTLRNESVQTSQLSATANLFPMLGAKPAIGRLFQAGDDRPDQPRMVVLSHDFWQTRYGGDQNVIGTSIMVNGQPSTIIGVLARDFRIPHGGQIHRADIWVPFVFTDGNRAARRSNFLFMLGRLADGATVATADAELQSVFSGIVSENPQLNGEGVRTALLQAESVGNVRKPLLLVFGAVGLVLLIACTNVASLLLARGVQRRREVSIRTALGASRWDTMRLSLLESFLVTGAGTLLGLLLAAAGVRTIGALAAAQLPQLAGLSMDWRVLVFGLVIATLVGIVCGAVPAWRSASVDPQEALGSNRGSGAGRSHHRALRLLVTAEIATSLVLLIGAGLLLRTFSQLMQSEPGFDAERVLAVRATVSPQQYVDRVSARGFLEPVINEIRAIPGVASAAAISLIPYQSWGNNSNIRYEGVPGDDPTKLPLVEQRRVTPSFFETMGQRLLAGRMLSSADDEMTPIVVVVNEALAKRDFPGQDVVGKRFHLSDTVFATIVGVVSDIRNGGPFNPPLPEMYYSYVQASPNATGYGIVVRSNSVDPVSLTQPVRAAVRKVDPTAALSSFSTMDDVIATSLGNPRFYLLLIGSFAVVAIVLAAAGLYGILSYSVAQRTREFGIRLALGSRPALLVQMVTFQGIGLVIIGIVLGLGTSVAATRLMDSILYGLSPLDLLSWISATTLLLVIGAAAAMIPALRATRVNPLEAIQTE